MYSAILYPVLNFERWYVIESQLFGGEVPPINKVIITIKIIAIVIAFSIKLYDEKLIFEF